MAQRLKNALTAAAVFAVTSVLFGYFIYGEVRWQTVIGLTLGGFLSWYFIIPRMNKNKEDR